MAQEAVLHKVIDIVVTRRTSPRYRIKLWADGEPIDLTGDTILFVAKAYPGGPLKLNESCLIDDQTTNTGELTVVLPEAKLRNITGPNDSVTAAVVWDYEVRRTHLGLTTVPLKGKLTLAPTI